MQITEIHVQNFKSFRNITTRLGQLTVIIGGNASGKTNFIQIFRFLRDIGSFGLDHAVSMQGGVEFLRNMKSEAGEELIIRVLMRPDSVAPANRPISLLLYPTEYSLRIRFHRRGHGFAISEERLRFDGRLLRTHRGTTPRVPPTTFEGSIIVVNISGRVRVESTFPDEAKIREQDIIPRFVTSTPLGTKASILEMPLYYFPSVGRLFTDMTIYDFDPKLPKKASPITGRTSLLEDGSNLAFVLKNIISNRDRAKVLFGLVQDILPFVERLNTTELADRSLLFTLREKYNAKRYLPSSLLSDGTINVLSTIIALYFESSSFSVIEEPERNIHPYLISRIMGMMRDASSRKQIVVTTHSPELVRSVDLPDIILVSRGNDGLSSVTRPSDNEHLSLFLSDELGIADMFTQNLLEV